MKRTHLLFLTLCLLIPLLSGCGKEKPTAVDSVKAIYDLYILGDTTEATELGMSKDDISNALNAYDEALSETIRSNFAISGLEIDDETVLTICQARKDALARMKAEYTLTTEEDSTAVVTLSTTYFDEVALDTDAFYKAGDEASTMDFADDAEYLNYVMDAYTQNLIEGYQNVTPSQDTKDIQVTCIIIGNTWLPEDMASFGSELGLTVAGQTD